MNIERCIAYAGTKGRKVQKRDLGRKFWPDQKPRNQAANMTNLLNGRTAKIDPAWVKEICDMCEVDANYLFDIKPMQP